MEFMDAGALTDVVLHTIMNENQVQKSWICCQIYVTEGLFLLFPDGDSMPGGAAGPELPAREGRGAQGHQVGQRTAHHEGRGQDNR